MATYAEDAIEREYKFDVGEGFELPGLAAATGGRVETPGARRQRTTYFDTPGRELWQQKVTLRFRDEEGGDGQGKWTVKLPDEGEESAPMAERREVSWPGAAGEVPREALDLVAGIAGPPFETVAVLDARRTRVFLYAPGAGEPWAELDDDTVEVVSGPKAGTHFRQVEVELLPAEAPPEAVGAVLSALVDAGAVPSRHSKFALATGL